MSGSAANLIWIDMEMTGLQPDSDRIIEMALLVTDPQLAIVAESPVWVLHQPDAVLDAMDSWNKGTHAKTGLIDRVRASTLIEAQAEAQALEFLAAHVPANVSPMCGNSICQDRRFLARWMPKLEAHARQGLHQGRQARGARRHPRVAGGAEVLSQDRHDHLNKGGQINISG